MLKSLTLFGRERLQSPPELWNSLALLDVDLCSSPEMLTSPPNMFTCLDLSTMNCEKLVEIQGMFTLEPIVNVDP